MKFSEDVGYTYDVERNYQETFKESHILEQITPRIQAKITAGAVIVKTLRCKL